MSPAPSLMPVRRASAVLVWALMLLVVSLGSLPQGSLRDGSFVTAGGVDDAAIASSRLACVVNADQLPASSDGLLPLITAAIAAAASADGAPVHAAAPVFRATAQRCSFAQPRAPPVI